MPSRGNWPKYLTKNLKTCDWKSMMRMKKTLIFLLALIALASCQSKNSFTLSGVINNPKNKTLILKKVNINSPVVIDSANVGKNGKFNFRRVDATEPDFYQLGFNDSDFITLLAAPGERIRILSGDQNLATGYEVKGSEGSEKVRMLDLRLAETKQRLDSLRKEYELATKDPVLSAKVSVIEGIFDSIVRDIRKKNIEFIIGNTTSMASIKALYQRIDENAYVLYDPRDLQYMKIVSDSLSKYYPKSKTVRALNEDVRRELAQMNSRQVRNMALSSPEIKLDPNLTDINGKRIALSSLRGKIVLLSFWSVESKECIAENLQLIGLYKTYNKKGFEIYQINLDNDETKWRQEVRFDELPWISTREDDPSNPRNAILYNVRALPANYLYDREGNIIGTNLHGKSLMIRLNQIFNE
jgi:thiol-disulfide isomerase/thioredoxin